MTKHLLPISLLLLAAAIAIHALCFRYSYGNYILLDRLTGRAWAIRGSGNDAYFWLLIDNAAQAPNRLPKTSYDPATNITTFKP